MSDFTEKVQDIVRRIPSGSVMTYGEVARRAGSPKAARAVGMIMKNNTDKSIPCHRVVRKDGTIGGYNGLRGEQTKEALLRSEGAIA